MKTLISKTIGNGEEYNKVSQLCKFPTYLWDTKAETYFSAFDKIKPQLAILDAEDLNAEFVSLLKGFPALRIVLKTKNFSIHCRDNNLNLQSNEVINHMQVLKGYFANRMIMYTENTHDEIKHSHQFWTNFNTNIVSIEPAADILSYNPKVVPIGEEYGDIDVLIISDRTRSKDINSLVDSIANSKHNVRIFSLTQEGGWELTNYCGYIDKGLEPNIMKQAKLVLGFHDNLFAVNKEVLKAIAVKSFSCTDIAIPIVKMFGKKFPRVEYDIKDINKILKMSVKDRNEIIEENYRVLTLSNTYFDRLHRMYYLFDLQKETQQVIITKKGVIDGLS